MPSGSSEPGTESDVSELSDEDLVILVREWMMEEPFRRIARAIEATKGNTWHQIVDEFSAYLDRRFAKDWVGSLLRGTPKRQCATQLNL